MEGQITIGLWSLCLIAGACVLATLKCVLIGYWLGQKQPKAAMDMAGPTILTLKDKLLGGNRDANS